MIRKSGMSFQTMEFIPDIDLIYAKVEKINRYAQAVRKFGSRFMPLDRSHVELFLDCCLRAGFALHEGLCDRLTHIDILIVPEEHSRIVIEFEWRGNNPYINIFRNSQSLRRAVATYYPAKKRPFSGVSQLLDLPPRKLKYEDCPLYLTTPILNKFAAYMLETGGSAWKYCLSPRI